MTKRGSGPASPAQQQSKRRVVAGATTTTTSVGRRPPPAADLVHDDHVGRPDFRSSLSADRHSCLAAPYAATDPRTARYFELAISKAKAPVVCASAGKIKGKAIYADRDIEQAARIWTEAPFVALQHEQNRGHLRCCQYCFVPLLSDYQARWREMAARWNRRDGAATTTTTTTTATTTARERPVGDDELDLALQQLRVNRRNCGLGGPGAACRCGEVYCSKLCQLRAYHEFHAILCPRADPFSAMNQFLAHMRHTNDIFLLVAKVVARLLSRFLTTRDVVKAREPIDMFYKKPWWEVVVVDKQLPAHDARREGDSTGPADAADSRPQPAADDARPPLHPRPRDSDGGGDHDSDADAPHAHDLRELLTYTHELLLDALESNLVRLEREDELHGWAVDDVWTACASILSFEFFAAQLGLFEMNNVSMEIDHPFRGLIEILDPDVHADGDPAANDNNTNDNDNDSDDTVVARVRRVLAHEEALLMAQQHAQQNPNSSADADADADADAAGATHGFPHDGGFLGIEGTALFPIICTMNHSCDPNCTVLYTKDGHAHVVAVRAIRRGEELCICYIDIDGDVRTREAHLREYQFKCFCARCVSERRALEPTVAETEAAASASASNL